MRIGIIGSGIAGMTAAHLLQDHHEVHVFEADGRPGGHANTVTVDLPGGPVAADTGFLVYNERTYPLFTRLLADLGVATHPSEMSFSLTDLRCGLEWRGTSLSTVFAQRRNMVRPAFLAMLADVVRFNRLSRCCWRSRPDEAGSGTLADLWPATAGRRASSTGIWSLSGPPFGRPTPRPSRRSGADVRRVLQPSRPARSGRPAILADGHRWIGTLRRVDPRATAPARAGCTWGPG